MFYWLKLTSLSLLFSILLGALALSTVLLALH
jgi:hypothetical protein